MAPCLPLAVGGAEVGGELLELVMLLERAGLADACAGPAKEDVLDDTVGVNLEVSIHGARLRAFAARELGHEGGGDEAPADVERDDDVPAVPLEEGIVGDVAVDVRAPPFLAEPDDAAGGLVKLAVEVGVPLEQRLERAGVARARFGDGDVVVEVVVCPTVGDELAERVDLIGPVVVVPSGDDLQHVAVAVQERAPRGYGLRDLELAGGRPLPAAGRDELLEQ